jgi:alpha-glucosidase (family GH31 glycosyl hydrolase)
MVEEALREYHNNNFPLDAIFLDIPYMDNYVDFTVNKTAFPRLLELSQTLHQQNMHIIPIIDAAISAEDLNNKYYVLGNSGNSFIKTTMYPNETYSNNLIN